MLFYINFTYMGGKALKKSKITATITGQFKESNGDVWLLRLKIRISLLEIRSSMDN